MKPTLQSLKFYLCSFITLGLAMCGLFSIGIAKLVDNLDNWDAFWLQSIKDFGYVLLEARTCNLAFFPLFPAIWKITSFGLLGICILNAFIYFASMILLGRELNLSKRQSLFVFVTSSSIFYFLPYSESLFFLFGTFILMGYKRSSPFIRNSGFFLISLTRAVTIIFIPIILFVELMAKNKSIKKKILSILSSLASASIGMAISAYVQYKQTGTIFYFLNVQQYWRRSLSWPIKLPLTTYSKTFVMGIDSMALAIGFTAIMIAIMQLYGRFFKTNKIFALSDFQLFSVAYFSIITIIDLFFTFYNYGQNTNIWSINRHLLSTPFYIVILKLILDNKHGKIYFGILSFFFLVSFCVTEVHSIVNMSILLIYYLSYIYVSSEHYKGNLPFNLISLPSIFIQILFLIRFLDGGWIA